MPSKKHPSVVRAPDTKNVPHTSGEVDKVENKFFRWRINSRYIDLDHREWGWETRLDIKEFFGLLEKHLHRFETTEWIELQKQNSCHPIPVEKIIDKAQRRLYEKCPPGIDSLFQIKVGGKRRVWGERKEDILYLIWYDPDHTIYPVDW